MTLPEVVLGVMFVGLIAYALFGGADFGAGIWDLLAGGTRRGATQRDVIEHAIGPVWEANHVWLIFVLVALTGFPVGFTAVASTLIPLTLAAFGMIARGGVRVPQEHHDAPDAPLPRRGVRGVVAGHAVLLGAVVGGRLRAGAAGRAEGTS
jgi:cytochrome bd-type quinol oxidase subunit 2